MPIAHMAALKVEEWGRMIDVNTKGLLYGVAAVLPIMQRQKQGVDGARQQIICGSSAGPKSGGPCKHTLREVQTVLGNMRPDLYDHELQGDHTNDLQEGAQRLQDLMKQVPDLTVDVRDVIADGDKVVVRAV